MIFNLFRKKENIFLALDIGTESVKAIFFGKKDKKTAVFGSAVAKFNKYGVFYSSDFEKEIFKKTIQEAIESARKNAFSSNISKKIKKKIKKPRPKIVLTFSPAYLKARITNQIFEREKSSAKISEKEEKSISQNALESSKKGILKKITREFGVLPEDIYWVSSEIISQKIDGYKVPSLKGFEGKNIEFEILTAFLLKRYLDIAKSVAKNLKYNVFQIVHPVDFLKRLIESVGKNEIYIDIGGNCSQIIIAENGHLKEIIYFKKGGEIFTGAIAQDLGIDENSARELKEKYSNRLLSKDSENKIKRVLSRKALSFFRDISRIVKEESGKEIFFSDIHLLGGGANLPDIKEIIEKERNESEWACRLPNKIRILYPEDLNWVECLTNIKNPQITPSLLICGDK